MARAIKNLWRLFIISRVLARHDALFLVEHLPVARAVLLLARLVAWKREAGRPGQRLARALSELGPTFIKVGQALSTRPDLLGEEVAADLSELQDRLSPFPSAQAKAIIEKELGAPLSELYADFHDEPVAAASIAQVHFATTLDGEEVAVKVLRPGVEKAFARDLDLLYWIAGLVEAAQPSLRRLKPVETVKTFEDSIEMEMDLRFEAAAGSELAENLLEDPGFHIPAIEWRLTSQRVLTLERIHGIPIDEREALIAAGHDPKVIITNAANAFFNMVFRDGFFHADMHPGNLFVDKNGRIVAVDFGIMGRVDRDTRRYLAEMLLGFLTGNYRRVAEVHFEAGYVPADKSIDAFTQASRSIGEPIMGRPLEEISVARLLGQLFQITEQFGMETQPQLLLLQKTMVLAEGLGRILQPDTNIWILAQPLVERWMRDNLGPQARVKRAVESVAMAAETLPRILQHAEHTAKMFGSASGASGGLKLHKETLDALTKKPQGARRPLITALPWVLVAMLLYALLVK